MGNIFSPFTSIEFSVFAYWSVKVVPDNSADVPNGEPSSHEEQEEPEGFGSLPVRGIDLVQAPDGGEVEEPQSKRHFEETCRMKEAFGSNSAR